MRELIDKLEAEGMLSEEELITLIDGREKGTEEYLYERARQVRRRHYGRDIYIRGLIEFTNYCRNDCFYCGLRRSNRQASRYRLTEEEILSCCRNGYRLGFRTFVLQGGEDPAFRDAEMVNLVKAIKKEFPQCAVTLSIGEKNYDSYLAFYEAGADRYLLRHETADEEHYGKLHPNELSFKNRMRCLADLKRIGYQTGCGIMVGSPGQTSSCLAKDMIYMKNLRPEMVGIGPFIPHHQTPFAGEEAGSLRLTLFMLGLTRLMLPEALLPSTTALGTIDPDGRELGILAGANVVMPNLSPVDVREKYLLYDNKICTGDEAAESLFHLKERMTAIGYDIVVDRGDFKPAVSDNTK